MNKFFHGQRNSTDLIYTALFSLPFSIPGPLAFPLPTISFYLETAVALQCQLLMGILVNWAKEQVGAPCVYLIYSPESQLEFPKRSYSSFLWKKAFCFTSHCFSQNCRNVVSVGLLHLKLFQNSL